MENHLLLKVSGSLEDLSKGLSDPNLSEEGKSKIRTQEIEVLKMVGEKDT